MRAYRWMHKNPWGRLTPQFAPPEGDSDAKIRWPRDRRTGHNRGMEVESRALGDGITGVYLAGKLTDGPSINQYLAAVDNDINAGNARILVNIEKIRWISSSGLGVMLNSIIRAKKKNGRMAFVGLQQRLERVFMVTKLEEVFDFYDNDEAAIETLKGDGG